MYMKFETPDDYDESPVDVTMVGDQIEIWNMDTGVWFGLTANEDQQMELLKMLWWSLYHNGRIEERPIDYFGDDQ